MNYLHGISNSRHIDGSMNWLLVRINVISKDWFIPIFLKGNIVIVWVISHLNDIPSCVLEGLVLAIKLHLIPVPRVSIGADKVVSVVCTSITKIKIYSFNTIQMCNSNTNPRCKLFNLHSPLFDPTINYFKLQVYFQDGAKAKSSFDYRGQSCWP